MARISRDDMYYVILKSIEQRSTCERGQVAAILVKDGRIISTGYNGAPSGLPHCLDFGCIPKEDGGCDRTVHAEANAIVFAAKNGISTDGSTMYCSYSPCMTCAKLIINAGIKRLVYLKAYRDHGGLMLLQKAGIIIKRFDENEMQ